MIDAQNSGPAYVPVLGATELHGLTRDHWLQAQFFPLPQLATPSLQNDQLVFWHFVPSNNLTPF